MEAILKTYENFSFDLSNSIITLISLYILLYLFRFYKKVWSLPPGPMPIPILGNLLSLLAKRSIATMELVKYGKTYGPVFTLWIGTWPMVIIRDLDIARETFNKYEFSGRLNLLISQLMSRGPYHEIGFADLSKEIESLRNLTISSVRKFSNNENLAIYVSDIVDDTVGAIISEIGINKSFDASGYIYDMLHNINCASAFGIKYDLNDPDYKMTKSFLKEIFDQEYTSRIGLWEFLPLFRYFDRKYINKFKMIVELNRDIYIKQYEKHCKEFQEENVRSFTDELILAKNRALKGQTESDRHLTDENLAMIIWEFVFGATETTQATFTWIVKILAFYTETQMKLREEIEEKIGERIPVKNDSNFCHYTNAFISECLRFRNIAPVGIFHKAVVKSQIGHFTIPAGTGVIFHQFAIHNDTKYWENPKEFIPERFLINGKYVTQLPSSFIPYSLGRRKCPGEKLTPVLLFLALVKFLQKTNGYKIILEPDENYKNLDIDETKPWFCVPKNCQIIIKN